MNPDVPIAASPKRRREPNAVFAVAGRIAYLPLVALSSYTIRGAEKLPAGGFVLTPNHYSNFDPLAVAFALWRSGRITRFLAKESLFRAPVVGWILRKTQMVPVDRTGRTRGSDPVAAGVASLKLGRCVVVYPEGSLTREPGLWPMRGKGGAVRMAIEAGVPLVPMATWGVHEILPPSTNKVSLFPRKKLIFVVGDPVDLSEYRARFTAEHLDAHEVAEATELVMRRIDGLLEGIRGEKAPAERYDPAKHNQSETGRFTSGS